MSFTGFSSNNQFHTGELNMQLNANTTESYDVKRLDKLFTLRCLPLGKGHWWSHCTNTVGGTLFPQFGETYFCRETIYYLTVKIVQEQGRIFVVVSQLLIETF